VSRAFGWFLLIGGSLFAAGTFATCSAIVPEDAMAPFILAGPLALVSWALGYALLRGGSSLAKKGDLRAKAARNLLIYAHAQTRGGRLTATDLAAGMRVSVALADELLTALAKETPDQVSVDVDDSGIVWFCFEDIVSRARITSMAPNAPPAMQGAPLRVRVDESTFLADEFDATETEPALRKKR
jgi:hypothetical protein